MPLNILVPMVILGIAGVAVLLHLLGFSKRRHFADETEAHKAWLDEFPQDTPLRVVLSHDQSAALVETAKGYGLVWPMGADSTARFLDGAQVTATRRELQIVLPDYTAPRIALKLDHEELARWPALLEVKR